MNESNIHILCMEDDAGLARLLERRLKRHGYTLSSVADGTAGLERMQQEHFDVVSIDYEMPGLDGLAVLERMQALEDPPPAIMISGAGDMDTAIDALKAGAADYVVKTVDGSYLDLLPRTIERVLEKERLQAEAKAARLALEEQTELLSLTLSSINEGLSVFDRDLRLMAWNRRWFELFDYPEKLAVAGTPHSAFVQHRTQRDPDNSEEAIAETIERVREGQPQTGEYRLHDSRIVETRSSPMPNGGMVTTYADITARRRAEEEQRVAAAVFQTTAEPMLITDAEVRIERCNPAFERLLGYSGEELVGRDPNMVTSGQHDAAFYQDLWENLHTAGHWRGTLWNRHKDGTLLALQATISAIHDGRGQVGHYVAVYTDVTEQFHREEAVRHQAHHDALTELPNRSLLLDRISHAIASAKRDSNEFALLFMDLDGFKPINDDFGHRAGDLLLQAVANRLTARCRDSDTVARYGGDEFVVLLRDVDDEDAIERVTEALIREIGKPVEIEGQPHEVSASVGIARYPHDAEDTAALLKAADQAMYQAKEAGKARYHLYGRQ